MNSLNIKVTIPVTFKTSDSALQAGHYQTDHVLNVRGKRHGICGWGVTGLGRKVFGGELEFGPYAATYGLCVMLDNHGGSGAESRSLQEASLEHVLDFGDVIEIDHNLYEINRVPYNSDQIKLVKVD